MYYLLNNGLIVSDKSEFVYICNDKQALVYATNEHLKKYVMRGTRTKCVFRNFGNIVKKSESLSDLQNFKTNFSLRGI